MGMKEILAAKKAAALQAQTVQVDLKLPSETVADLTAISIIADKSVEATVVEALQQAATTSATAPMVDLGLPEEPAPTPAPALSFKEKMELRKKELAAQASTPKPTFAPAPAPTAAPESSKPVLFSPEDSSTFAPVAAASSIPEVVQSMEGEEDLSIADATALQDIQQKVAQLEEIQDIDMLKNAMSALKKALKVNPSAAAFMHDADIGKMVLALYRTEGAAQLAMAKDKTSTKKAKAPSMTNLTQAQIEAAFAEM